MADRITLQTRTILVKKEVKFWTHGDCAVKHTSKSAAKACADKLAIVHKAPRPSDDEIFAMFCGGMSFADIARSIDRSAQRVSQIVKAKTRALERLERQQSRTLVSYLVGIIGSA